MKGKRILTAFLGIISIAIWGLITYRVYDYVKTPGDREAHSLENGAPSEHSLQKIKASNMLLPSQAEYDAKGLRDPFQTDWEIFHIKDSLKKALIPKPPVKVWLPPPFRLSGILETGRKKTAMLEGIGQNGQTFFLQEGDTLSGLKVLKIESHLVSYLYQKKKSEFTIENK